MPSKPGGPCTIEEEKEKQKHQKKSKKCCLANWDSWESGSVVCLLSDLSIVCCQFTYVFCLLGLCLWLINYCGMYIHMYTLKFRFVLVKNHHFIENAYLM